MTLTPSTAAYTPIIHNMVRENWPECFGGAEWTSINVYPPLLRLVAQISGRVFNSTEASRSEQWIQLATVYVSEVIPYAQKLKMWPEFLRPFVWRYIPGYEALHAQRTSAKKMIAKTLRRKKESGGAPLEDPPSMLDYLASGKHADLADDLEQQFFLQMTLIVASVHTSASTTTQSLFDLAVHPECIAELRDEARAVLAESGGVFTRAALAKLKKLDSFIKEVQRFNSPDLSKFPPHPGSSIVLKRPQRPSSASRSPRSRCPTACTSPRAPSSSSPPAPSTSTTTCGPTRTPSTACASTACARRARSARRNTSSSASARPSSRGGTGGTRVRAGGWRTSSSRRSWPSSCCGATSRIRRAGAGGRASRLMGTSCRMRKERCW